jgi:lycopene beta-cyclase
MGSFEGDNRFDYILVGGGLQNALIALALLDRQPDARLVLVERDGVLGGNHTWCFHVDDVTPAARKLVEPLVEQRWSGYEVRFPNLQRTLDHDYAAVSSDRLRRVVERRIAASDNALLLRQAEAVEVDEGRVILADGRRLDARVVVDARGPGGYRNEGPVAYQKFFGLELELGRPSGLEHPILMDAQVPQKDGFRFFYVLPLDEQRVLVEDTYFSDTPELDIAGLRSEVIAYALRAGLHIDTIAREEIGVLPLPRRGARRPLDRGPLVAGFQGGWFHPTTGYSFPVALRLAEHVASTTPDTLFGDGWQRLVSEQKRQSRYALFLNRMLFGAFAPEDRWNALERFYRLPEATIRRFYAMTTTPGDRTRILCGRPPRHISLGRALTRGMSI